MSSKLDYLKKYSNKPQPKSNLIKKSLIIQDDDKDTKLTQAKT